MMIKTVRMGISIPVSRSGFTAWDTALARNTGLRLVGRTRGKLFIAAAALCRIVFDQSHEVVPEKNLRHRRKAAGDDV